MMRKSTQFLIFLVVIFGILIVLAFSGDYGDIFRTGTIDEDAVTGNSLTDEELEKLAGNISGDDQKLSVTNEQLQNFYTKEYTYSGELTSKSSSGPEGTILATYLNNKYGLFSTFLNLADVGKGQSYAGWIVRRGDDFDVVNVGRARNIKGDWVLMYKSGSDLTDHDHFVLTLQEDEAETVPGEVILQGELTKLDF